MVPAVQPDEREKERFALGWLRTPGAGAESVGSVTLPSPPTTLGEARGGLEVVGEDEGTTRWLRAWADTRGEERNLLIQLPGGWFELTDATIATAPGTEGAHVIRFNRRSAARAPAPG